MNNITVTAEDARKIIENELIASGVSRLTASVYTTRILEALSTRLDAIAGGRIDG